jgi:two-component system, OmpR family, alkaline phosphatase synthesis response regulator PhoP
VATKFETVARRSGQGRVAIEDEVIDVLLVEDDPEIVEMYSEKLSRDGYAVTVAEDGEQALVKAMEVRPDIVFLDLELPRKDGFEVLRALRADPRTADTPVIILTNHGGAELMERGIALGANEYLVKATTSPSLLAADISIWVRE